MPIGYNLVSAEIHLDRLADNFRLLALKGTRLMPVVKADAYGHGLYQAAEALSAAGARAFAVGTVEEAVSLRKRPQPGRIVSLLGPVYAGDFPPLWEHDIVPVIHCFEQLEGLAAAAKKFAGLLEIALKFETGMGRLGFDESDLPEVTGRLGAMPNIRVAEACSHLSSADDPEARDFTLDQGERFKRIATRLRQAGFQITAHLANSAAILAYPELHFDMQRPGISLYGTNPFWGTEWADKGLDLMPVMQVGAPVISVHDLKAGRPVSYGRTFTADRDMRVAVVAVGYADNYSRTLSNRGEMVVRGRRAPVLGRVCMQLTAVDVTRVPGVKPGDRAYVLGGEGDSPIRPEELASWWGTITYEVFCLLGQNPRKYL